VYDWNLEEEFQSYAGEEIILINEYKGPHQIKYGTWLKLVDKWPYKIKRKGMCPFPMLAHTVIVASIFSPEEIEWNLSSKDNLNQLLDRFEVKKLEGPNRRHQIVTDEELTSQHAIMADVSQPTLTKNQKAVIERGCSYVYCQKHNAWPLDVWYDCEQCVGIKDPARPDWIGADPGNCVLISKPELIRQPA
jgi:hypothetical protein